MGTPVVIPYTPPQFNITPPTPPSFIPYFYTEDQKREHAAQVAAYNTALASYQAAQASAYGSQVQAGTSVEQARLAAQESALERAARITAQAQGQTDQLALSAQNNAAQLAQLQAQITSTGGLASQAQTAEMARLQAQISSQSALQTGAQTFGASESAAERAARIAELTQSSTAAQSLEALRTAGAKDIGAQANAAELQRLQTQIAATGGLATTAQAAEMARLQAQLGSAASLQSSAQTYGASETAAERAARMAELAQTQSGAQSLAGYQNTLQQQTEEQRYMRALAEQNTANARMDTVMGKFGFTGATPTGGAAGADPYASGATDTQELDAENAAFARAKDKIGLASRAASDSLSAQMASRGITGSGIEAQQLGLASDQAVGQISDTAREQALASLQRRYQVSDRNAALTSTKRAQDIGLVQSLASLAKPTGGAAY